MSKLHLLYVLPYLEQGGTEKHTLALITYFRSIYDVSLLAPIGSTSYQFEALGIPYRQFCRWDFNFFRGIKELSQHIQQIDQQRPIGLVHVHASHELMAVVKLILPRVPVVFTVHGYHGTTKNLSYWLSSQIANWFADRVIAVCQAEADILQKHGLKSHKTTVIYNGVDSVTIDPDRCEELRQKFTIGLDQIILGTVARLSPDKGIIYLLQAMASLTPKHHNLHLIIAGTGAQRGELEQLVWELNLQKNVTFAGYLDRLHDLISLFDIFVLPSLQEAFSLATLEAMALAKPIVATTVGGFREQIQAGETGFLVPPKSSKELALALEQLITNPSRRQQMGRAAQIFYRQNFTAEKMLNQTKSVYQQLTGLA